MLGSVILFGLVLSVKSQCSVTLQGSTYNLENFDMKGHKSIVLGLCGRDVTSTFAAQHNNDPNKLAVLRQFLVRPESPTPSFASNSAPNPSFASNPAFSSNPSFASNPSFTSNFFSNPSFVSNSASTSFAWLRPSAPASNRFSGFSTGTCQRTRPDVFGAGPFENGYGDTAGNEAVPYPVRFNLLVSPAAQSTPADEQLLVYGVVQDTNCIPLAGYRVQIWSASRNAVYSSSAQQSYRGAAITDAEGRFSFQTVFPASYANRPSHLHIEVWRPGTQTPTEGVITTQFYFAGDRFLRSDPGSAQAEPSRILNLERSPEGKVIVRPIITV